MEECYYTALMRTQGAEQVRSRVDSLKEKSMRTKFFFSKSPCIQYGEGQVWGPAWDTESFSLTTKQFGECICT